MTAQPTTIKAQAAQRAASIEDLRRKAPRTTTLLVLLEEVPEPSPDASDEAWDEYRQRVADVTVEMTFRAIGARHYDDLQKAYPATQAQRADCKRRGLPEPIVDNERFTPALIAAASVTPKLSYEEVRELIESETWNDAEVNEMFLAALNVNVSARKVPELKKGSGRIPTSGR